MCYCVVFLFKCAHTEHLYFFFCKITPITATYVLLSKTCKIYTIELDYMVTEAFEDTTHDTVLTAVNFNADLLLIGF